MTQRQAKVESLIRQQVALVLAEQLSADRAYVTVTAVDVAADLRQATVWFSVMAPPRGTTEQVRASVEELRGEIQHQVATQLETKFVPRLTLKLDPGVEYAQHIQEVLKEL